MPQPMAAREENSGCRAFSTNRSSTAPTLPTQRALDYDLDADIAADLITNHLAMLTAPTWAAQRPDSASALRGAGETLHWHAADEPGLGEAGEWFIERGPDGGCCRRDPARRMSLSPGLRRLCSSC